MRNIEILLFCGTIFIQTVAHSAPLEIVKPTNDDLDAATHIVVKDVTKDSEGVKYRVASEQVSAVRAWIRAHAWPPIHRPPNGVGFVQAMITMARDNEKGGAKYFDLDVIHQLSRSGSEIHVPREAYEDLLRFLKTGKSKEGFEIVKPTNRDFDAATHIVVEDFTQSPERVKYSVPRELIPRVKAWIRANAWPPIDLLKTGAVIPMAAITLSRGDLQHEAGSFLVPVFNRMTRSGSDIQVPRGAYEDLLRLLKTGNRNEGFERGGL